MLLNIMSDFKKIKVSTRYVIIIMMVSVPIQLYNIPVTIVLQLRGNLKYLYISALLKHDTFIPTYMYLFLYIFSYILTQWNLCSKSKMGRH